MVTAIAVMVKGGNVTEQWHIARTNALFANRPDVDIRDKISLVSLKTFSSLYPRDNRQLGAFYNALAIAYVDLKRQQFNSLGWIIERSTTLNVTPAMVWAEIVAKTVFLDIDQVIKFVGENQFLETVSRPKTLWRIPFAP